MLNATNRFTGKLNAVVARLVGGGNRVFLYGTRGMIWQSDYRNIEPQNAAIGEFTDRHPGLEIWCRSRFDLDQRPYVLNAYGEILDSYDLTERSPPTWTRKGIEVIGSIFWTGARTQMVTGKARHEAGYVALIDALTGKFDTIFVDSAARLYVADILGDWREEVVVLGGNTLNIYANSDDPPAGRKPSLWNQKLYKRAKQTWNYYGT